MNNEDTSKVVSYNTVGGCFRFMTHLKLRDVGNWVRLQEIDIKTA